MCAHGLRRLACSLSDVLACIKGPEAPAAASITFQPAAALDKHRHTTMMKPTLLVAALLASASAFAPSSRCVNGGDLRWVGDCVREMRGERLSAAMLAKGSGGEIERRCCENSGRWGIRLQPCFLLVKLYCNLRDSGSIRTIAAR
jgi:hypothetical protein